MNIAVSCSHTTWKTVKFDSEGEFHTQLHILAQVSATFYCWWVLSWKKARPLEMSQINPARNDGDSIKGKIEFCRNLGESSWTGDRRKIFSGKTKIGRGARAQWPISPNQSLYSSLRVYYVWTPTPLLEPLPLPPPRGVSVISNPVPLISY